MEFRRRLQEKIDTFNIEILSEKEFTKREEKIIVNAFDSYLEKNLNVKVGEFFTVDKYKLFFENVSGKTEANYDMIAGNFSLLDGNKNIGYLKPEIRVYHQPPTVTSEASIKSDAFRDFYITMTNIKESDYFNIRFQYKPFMNFIWFSALLIALGGLLSVLKKDKIQL